MALQTGIADQARKELGLAVDHALERLIVNARRVNALLR